MSNSPANFDPIQLRPTEMLVDLDALAENFRAIRKQVGGKKIMPVIKCNAYGHGLTECARVLETAGADFFGVAVLEEAVALRLAGVKIPILAMGGIFNEQIPYFLNYGIDILASSLYKLRAVEEAARNAGKRARVHLEIDTGMERIGVHSYSAQELLEGSLECKHCDIVGVSTHFATQDGVDTAHTKYQLDLFLEAISFYEKRGLPAPMRHAAASGAIIQLPESHLDLVRPGLILYGVPPAKHLKGAMPLKPVMSLRSKVVYFKVVKENAGVSYDHLWYAPEDTRIVTVPIGYGDGFLRAFSNASDVLIHGNRYPVVGAICMDQMMVNIGPDGVAYNGDEVIIVGSQGDQEITLLDMCDRIGGNPREFAVSVNARVPRKYLGKASGDQTTVGES